MATLALSLDFLNHFHKLEPKIRQTVSKHADTFARLTVAELYGMPGLHLESYVNAKDPRARTIRIDDNHRGVLLDAGDQQTFILVMVGNHAEVDHWMMKSRFKVNVATGAVEIVDVLAVEEASRAVPSPVVGAALLYGHRRDKDFVQLGIDADLVPVVRAFTSEDQALGLAKLLPQGQSDALLRLLDDDTVEEIYAEIAGAYTPNQVDEEDLVAALATPASQSQFRVVDGQDELADMLAQPLAQWRVYPHPSQRELAYRPVFNGPVRVTGGAGTGKTVVAMHRAKSLADALGDHGTGKPILFTTFTRNLAQAIEADLRNLGGSDLLDSVEVANVDRITFRIIQDVEGKAPALAEDSFLSDCWRDVVDEEGVPFSSQFLAAEWEQVILAQGCKSRAEYFSASRAGRGVPLDRRARAEVWRAVEAFLRKLSERGVRTFLQLADAAAGYLAARTVKPYAHVIVDEAQDLHEAQWRMLRAIVEPGPNDLFLVGDTHQRIYDRHSTLSKVGINIRGRSKKLKINYRTTHEILAWSMALLGEGEFDDLDDGVDNQTVAGYHSLRHGVAPELSGHRSTKEQIDALVAQVKQWVDDGVDEEAIGISARVHASFDAAEAALRAAGVQTCRLPQRDLPDKLGVRIGTMHRMKGLEFARVAIIDVDDLTLPLANTLTSPAVDQTQHQADLLRERCLLYVAATRARDALWLSWSGKKSRFLGD